MNINEAIEVLKDSEAETISNLQKVEKAKAIIGKLAQLRVAAREIVTNIHCECAVIEAKKIINA